MNVEIIVPALGESVSEATVAKWYKKPGDVVKLDELLLELETEKVTLEVSAVAEGILDTILKQEGDVVSIGQVLGSIKPGIATQNTEVNQKASSTPVLGIETRGPTIQEKKVDSVSAMPPSVQKLVKENNLNPATIAGTGKDGRINKGDVLNVLATTTVRAPEIETVIPGDKPVEKVRMSRLRKTIAQRLKDSQNTAAILTTFNEIDMNKVIELRTKYKDKFKEKYGVN